MERVLSNGLSAPYVEVGIMMLMLVYVYVVTHVL